MFRTLKLIPLLLFLSFITFGQDDDWFVEISENPILVEDQGKPRVLFVEQIDNGFFVLREHIYRNTRNRKFFIEHLDLRLRNKKIVNITEDLDEKNFEIQDVLRLNDRLLLLSTSYQRDSKERIFYLQEIQYDSFKIHERIEVYRLEADMNSFFKVSLTVTHSEEKIMFSVIPEKRVPLIKKPENDFREIVILNNDLTVFENIGRLDMTVGALDFTIEQALLNDQGILFFLAQKIPDRKSEAPSYYLLRYRRKMLEAGAMVFTDGQIQRARIDLNPNGTILFMGYYSENKRFNPGIGVVSTVFSQETLEPNLIYAELIKNDVLMTGLRERQKRKWRREIEAGRDLKVNHDIVPLYFFRHPSGDVSMIGEIQYVNIESTSFTQAGTMHRFTYNYEHIFVTRIKSDGKILWTSKIPKLYRGSFDLVQSFHAFQEDENIHLVFNDNSDNLILNPRKGVRYLSGRSRFNFLVKYTINAKGESENRSLLEYNTPPFDRIEMLNIFTDAARSSQNQLLFSTSGKLGFYYLLIGRKMD